MRLFHGLKCLALSGAILNLIFQPLAVAAQAEKSNVALIAQLMKTSGMNKNTITVGQFYRSIRNELTPEMYAGLKNYIFLFQDQKMPAVDVVTFHDKNKVEQVRLGIQVDGKTYSIQTEGFGPTFGLKVQNVPVGDGFWKDMRGTVEKVAKEVGAKNLAKTKATKLRDLDIVPTKEEWHGFNQMQKLQYLVLIRYLVEDIQVLLPPTIPTKGASVQEDPIRKYAMVFEMLNPQAYAQGRNSLVGQPCIVAGWVSVYNGRNSCGGTPEGRIDLNAQQDAEKAGLSKACSSGVACNPVLYGYSSGGQPYCVDNSKMLYATKDACNEDESGQPRLRRGGQDEVDDVRKIIESYLSVKKGADSKLKKIGRDKDGKIAVDILDQGDYSIVMNQIAKIKETLNTALQICQVEPGEINDDNYESYKLSASKATSLYKIPNQKSACDNIIKRYIAINLMQVSPPQPPPTTPGQAAQEVPPLTQPKCPPPPGVGGPPDCQVVTGPGPMAPPPPGTGEPVPPPVEDKGSMCHRPQSEGGGFKCGWLIALPIFAAGIFAIAASSKKKRPIKQKDQDIVPSPTDPQNPPANPTPANPPVVVAPPKTENANNPNSSVAPPTKVGGSR